MDPRSTAVVATTVPSGATRLTELSFGPPTTAKYCDRDGVGDGRGDTAMGEGVLTAARGAAVGVHAVKRTSTNANLPINIQNEGHFAPLRGAVILNRPWH